MFTTIFVVLLYDVDVCIYQQIYTSGCYIYHDYNLLYIQYYTYYTCYTYLIPTYTGRTRSSAITASPPYASSTEATSQLSRLTPKQYHVLWVYPRQCGLSWRSVIITVSYMQSRFVIYVCIFLLWSEGESCCVRYIICIFVTLLYILCM